MTDSESDGDQYMTDASTDSMCEPNVELDLETRKPVNVNRNRPQYNMSPAASNPRIGSVDSNVTQGQSSFAVQLQEFVMRALFQSTASGIGPPQGLFCNTQGTSSGSSLLPTEEHETPSTWNETTYNKSDARRNKMTPSTRTSAGEGSDSQAEYPTPENESRKDRSVRTRRLNRSRMRKAKELTENRKAVKNKPYVIHVDGTGRAQGIHKHLWRTAVRGQCGRLDPAMDNINHHPKHVVDSIWRALETEWEF